MEVNISEDRCAKTVIKRTVKKSMGVNMKLTKLRRYTCDIKTMKLHSEKTQRLEAGINSVKSF